MTPTQRALKDLRELGYTAQVVEKRVPYKNITQDLFGCIDIVAMRRGTVKTALGWATTPSSGIVGIQVCAGASHAVRREKILDEPRARLWLQCGGSVEIWSYAKRGARGKRKTWQLRRESITLADF